MGYERYPRGNDQSDPQDSRRDFGTGREYTYSSARDYAAAGRLGRDDDDGDRSRDRYGARDYGRQSYGRQDYGQSDANRSDYGRSDYGRSDYGRPDAGRADYGRAEYGQGNQPGRGGSGYGDRDHGSDYGNRDQARGGSYGGSQGFYGRGREGGGQQQGGSREYHGSYASDGRRFEDVGRYRHADDDNYRGQQQGRDQSRGGYGRQPQGYDYEDRGFLARAGDEVRSWFGDDEAERRREMDSRYDERSDPSQGGGQSRYGNRSRHHDEDYHSWRSGQIAALDRDYDEYRNENRSRFENEFSSWRTIRQGQRDQLNKVTEHQEVVGSDGAHVGTVDKVRGDRILLTKNDVDAGGQHHSIPSSWVQSVDDKVTLTKSADDAKKAWRDEDRNQAMFGYGDNNRQQGSSQYGAGASSTATATAGQSTTGQSTTGQSRTGQSATDQTRTDDDDFKSDGNLNKSFPGTY